MRVSVFGLGHVGCVTAACLARAGHDVIGVDVEPARVAMVQAGLAPVAEPGLAPLLAAAVSQGRLRATADGPAAVAGSEVALICVPTPPQPGGGLDIGAVRTVGELIGRALASANQPYTVVLRSTVLPGTTERVLRPALSADRPGPSRRLAVNPEFLRTGSALSDTEAPPFILAGCDGDETMTVVRELYGWLDAPFVRTDLRTAEMVKCVSNAFHALKVAFANEVADLCTAMAADPAEVMRVFALDRKLNIGPAYLSPGFAFGGPCLEKDLAALVEVGQHAGWGLPLLSAILPSNALQIARAADSILAAHRRIGVAGLAFKSDATSFRGSPVVELVRRLAAGGGAVRLLARGATEQEWSALDLPAAVRCDTVAELLADADVLVLGGGPDAAAVAAEARRDQLVLDLARGDFRAWWARQCAGDGAAPPAGPA